MTLFDGSIELRLNSPKGYVNNIRSIHELWKKAFSEVFEMGTCSSGLNTSLITSESAFLINRINSNYNASAAQNPFFLNFGVVTIFYRRRGTY